MGELDGINPEWRKKIPMLLTKKVYSSEYDMNKYRDDKFRVRAPQIQKIAERDLEVAILNYKRAMNVNWQGPNEDPTVGFSVKLGTVFISGSSRKDISVK